MDLEKILALTKNLSVLVVEDELALRESFQFLLQNLFAEVDTAEDGQEALSKIDERDYDIVLTDLSMPRMSGLRLVDHIRKKSHSQIVIAISAHDDKEFAEALALHNSILEKFERDTPKVLPTENKGAFAVATKAKEVTITHTPDENADNNSIETTEVREDGATITTTVTTASDGSQTITTTGGGETVIRYNVAPHGFSRRPTHKKERVTQSATKDSPSTIKTETRSWTDADGNSGTVEIDIITLSDKPVKLIGVRGRPSGKSRTKNIRAAGNIAKSLDVFSVDKNGRILIGWADSNGNAPLADGTFANGIWTRRHQYDATGAKPDKITGKKDEFIYKVSYQYNDNYDPTFDGNEERVKDKGSPKQDDKNKIDLILLNKLIDDENKDYGASGVVEAISVKNSETADYRGTLVKQKTGVYKHINGNEYTVVTNVSSGDTVNMDFLFSAMLDDAQGQPNYDELTG